MKLVKIIWEDSVGNNGGWMNRAHAEDMCPHIHTSIGYVIRDEPEEKFITIAATLGNAGADGPGEYLDGVVCIPRSAILDTEVISG